MTENEQIAMRETVKQCIEHSRWPPWKEPFTLNARGECTSARQEPVDAFLQQLNTWGYTVVSLHDRRGASPHWRETIIRRTTA